MDVDLCPLRHARAPWVGSGTFATAIFVADVVARCFGRHPGIALRLVDGDRAEPRIESRTLPTIADQPVAAIVGADRQAVAVDRA